MAAQTSSRKQWRLFRGPKGNIQSLGWTEFGCPESQVKLAKELLEDNGEECLDKEEKNRLGVYWLLKASEKGHEEATRLLEECLENGTGITEHNISDVRCCLEMPKEEKLSREAAKELFLSLSQGENYITSNQLFRETLKYSEGPIPVEAGVSQKWMLYDAASFVRLTEEMVVSTGSLHVRGILPAALNRPLVRGSPLAFGTLYLAELLQAFHPLYLLLLLSMCGMRFVLDAAPALIYYSSLIAMIISSCAILSKKWEFNQFQRWSYALVACGCSEEVSVQAQWAYCMQNAHPFIIFIISLLINLVSSSYIPMVPFSEIAAISVVISLYMLFNLMRRNNKIDVLVIFTFILHLIARYPYELDTFVFHYWRYLDVHVPTFTSFAVGTSIEFCLNFRVILYLILPGFFLKIASRNSWLGTFTTLLPHLVCLAWWQMAVSASNGATYFGLIRSCLGLVLLVLFLPLSSISTLLIPVGAVCKFFITKQISMSLAVGCITVISALYISTKLRKKWKFLAFFQVVICALSLFLVLDISKVENAEKTDLHWKEFHQVCGKADIRNQERCTEFVGLPVSWEGRVLSTRLATVHNPIDFFLNYLPDNIRRHVVCLLGETLEDCRNQEDCHNSLKRCHISNWNRYEYEIEVELRENGWSDITMIGWLNGEHHFRNFSIALKQGDMIWFSGTLIGHKLSYPQISLIHAKCLSCAPADQIVPEVHSRDALFSAVEKILTFFYPFVSPR